MKKPELLAPAGNMEKLKMACIYGADAVFLAGKQFGLRAFSDNFTLVEMAEAVQFAHRMGKKVYVTVNMYPHNSDLIELPRYLRSIRNCGVDGVIVADPGVFRMVQDTIPDMPIHISTQANSTNWSSVRFWEDLGASRVVLARELSLREMTEIRRSCKAELEVFVHGAMCISYSGRCLLSNYLTQRDSNRGQCAQPCRWKYNLVEEKRPNEFFPIMEDDNGTYIFNSKDLCLFDRLPELIACGIDSFKIEGRMKSVHYVATVVNAYRRAIDAYFADPQGYQPKQEWLDELLKVSHRDYTEGFYEHKTTEEDQIYGTSSYQQTHDFVGLVKTATDADGYATVEQRNNMKVGETIEVFQPNNETFTQVLTTMFDENGEEIAVAPHPQQIVRIKFDRPVEPFAMIRRACKKK
ncbi:MAG: U32 family peptidase [Selenomonadales bacterium]|nr:U32 family peptidase [Selenomonadales bacterium]MBQ2246776.1 U32 family peptidase [Selenomonadales bacterium]MBQ5588077.1 U32 family peptidase [Selenomonadales bacterium]